MNKKIIYVPISFLVAISILYISISVPSYSLLLHFSRLIYLAVPLAIITGIISYSFYKNQLDFYHLYVLVGSSVLFSFLIWFALITFFNSRYTTNDCNISSFEVVAYKGRMASGYGKLDKGEIKANQWVLTILKDDQKKTFVLNKDITDGVRVTNTIDLQFCKGLLGTEYLNIEQLPG